jgi:hypothetical protein
MNDRRTRIRQTGMRRFSAITRAALVAVMCAVAAAGCGSPAEPEGAGTPSGPPIESVPAETEIDIDWTECRNDAEGYAISYPSSWHTATNAPENECAFFDPEPFEIVAGSEFPVSALEAHRFEEGSSLGAALEQLTDPTFERTISVDVYGEGDLSGMKIETEATGAGLLDNGTRTYQYILNWDNGGVFVVKTTELAGRDYEKAKLIVDEAVRTLDFFAPPITTIADELPAAVRRTRDALIDAAAANDYDALAALVPESGFTYTYGGPFPGGPAAYWKQVARESDPSPSAVLKLLLGMPYTKVQDNYVWPFAYDRDPASLTDAELDMLARVASPQEMELWKTSGHYLGWRVGIRSDGTWIFFVAGD